MVHLSDLDWNRPGEQVIEEYNKGDMVKAVVLDVDVDKERISLSASSGIEVEYNGMKSFIRRSDLSATAPSSAPSASRSATRSMSA
jgi:small subunit ribosomal protein S1